MGWAHGLALLLRNFFSHWGDKGSRGSGYIKKGQKVPTAQSKLLCGLQNVVKTQPTICPNAINTLLVFT